MRISDWSSDVCSSDLPFIPLRLEARQGDIIGVGQDARGFVGISLVPLIGGVGPGPGDDYLAPSLRPRLDLKRVHLLVGKSLDKLGVVGIAVALGGKQVRSEEHTSELQSLMRSSYAVFCLKKKNKLTYKRRQTQTT